MDDRLSERAKADPETFRQDAVHALKEAFYTTRADGVGGRLERMTVEEALRQPWIWSQRPDHDLRALEIRAKAYNDALLHALTEMTPVERGKLGW